MQAGYLKKRVELLEKTVDGSTGLTEQVGLLRTDVNQLKIDVSQLKTDVRLLRTDLTEFHGQFLQFQDETRSEFSAVRQEMKTEFAAVRREMTTEFAAVHDDVGETRSQMRTLHEEVLSRIALLQEGLNGRHKKPTRANKR